MRKGVLGAAVAVLLAIGILIASFALFYFRGTAHNCSLVSSLLEPDDASYDAAVNESVALDPDQMAEEAPEALEFLREVERRGSYGVNSEKEPGITIHQQLVDIGGPNATYFRLEDSYFFVGTLCA